MYHLHGGRDVKRQAFNVFRMELLGAKVQSVTDGSRVLKDAVNAALGAWVANVRIPTILWDPEGPQIPISTRFSKVSVGREAKRHFAETKWWCAAPDAV